MVMEVLLESKAQCLGENVDRFSNIPDGVVQEILSLISIEDLARTCLVSKRFRRLCISVPDLYLDFTTQERRIKARVLGNYIDRLFKLRNGAKIRRFGLHPFHIDSRFGLNPWIYSALMCKVEEMDLTFQLDREEEFKLPRCIVDCKSLKLLKLRLYYGVLKLPNPNPIKFLGSKYSDCFHLFQVLTLYRVRVDLDLSSPNWVSSLFPLLKELNLEKLDGLSNVNINNVNITSSSVECLSISDMRIDGVIVFAERLQRLSLTRYSTDLYSNLLFTLCAPNLKEFMWRGQSYADYCFQGSFTCLQIATVADASNSRIIPIDYNKSYIFQLVQFLSQAKSLKLEGWVLEDLFEQDSLLDNANNVQHLNIQACCKKFFQIPTLMASFLGRLPNLKALTLNYILIDLSSNQSSNSASLKGYDFDFDIEYWQSQNIACIHQLKAAKIKILQWEYEIGLVRYLIKHAKALEEIIVTISSWIDNRRSKHIKEMLSQYTKTFRDATFRFVLE